MIQTNTVAIERQEWPDDVRRVYTYGGVMQMSIGIYTHAVDGPIVFIFGHLDGSRTMEFSSRAAAEVFCDYFAAGLIAAQATVDLEKAKTSKP